MTTDKSSEREALKPCPFCGSEAAMHKVHDPDGPNDQGYYVECGKCGASTNLRFSCGEDARPLLVEQWNRRAALPQQAQETSLPPQGASSLLPEPPTLPQSLLDLIGNYGMARTERMSEVARIYLWQDLIAAIKQYAKDYALAASPAPAPQEPALAGWLRVQAEVPYGPRFAFQHGPCTLALPPGDYALYASPAPGELGAVDASAGKRTPLTRHLPFFGDGE